MLYAGMWKHNSSHYIHWLIHSKLLSKVVRRSFIVSKVEIAIKKRRKREKQRVCDGSILLYYVWTTFSMCHEWGYVVILLASAYYVTSWRKAKPAIIVPMNTHTHSVCVWERDRLYLGALRKFLNTLPTATKVVTFSSYKHTHTHTRECCGYHSYAHWTSGMG